MRPKRSKSGLSSRSELSVVVAPRRRPEEKVWTAKARPRLWSDAEPLRLRAADTRTLVRVQAAKEADRCG